MLRACTARDDLPSCISSLAVRARLDAIQNKGITEPTLAGFQLFLTALDEARATHPNHGIPGGCIADEEYASRILTGTRTLAAHFKSRIDDSLQRLEESDRGAAENPAKLVRELEKLFTSRDARARLDAAFGYTKPASPDAAPL